TARSTLRSLLGAAVAAAARSLDPDDIARPQLPGQLRGLLLPVDQRAAKRTVLAAGATRWRASSPLREHRQPAVLEHAQLTNDAVSTSTGTLSARAGAQLPALDAKRIFELDCLGGRGERVRHRDVDTARAVRLGTRALAAADGLVVREPLVAEREVVHRPLPG